MPPFVLCDLLPFQHLTALTPQATTCFTHMFRLQCKTAKRTATHKLLVSKDKSIGDLKDQMAELTKTTTTRIVKLEDELARLNMSKEVVVQQLNSTQAEVRLLALLHSEVRRG